jgi:hypothetical protein
MMDWLKIKAVAINIDVDEDLLEKELRSIPHDRWDTQHLNNREHGWKTVFLNKNSTQVFKDFKTAKLIPHSEWVWDDTIHIPYIRSLVESLPMKTIGMIRAFVLTGPLVIHVDSDNTTPLDLDKNLGLTIATKMGGPMWMEGGVKVKEKCVFFNDSIPHGFPQGSGEQISIRIFGEFAYDNFNLGTIYE